MSSPPEIYSDVYSFTGLTPAVQILKTVIGPWNRWYAETHAPPTVEWDRVAQVLPTRHGFDGLFCKEKVPARTTVGFLCGSLCVYATGYEPMTVPFSGYNVALTNKCTVKVYGEALDARATRYVHDTLVYGTSRRMPLNGQLVNHTCSPAECNCEFYEEEAMPWKTRVTLCSGETVDCKVEIPLASVVSSRPVQVGEEFLANYGDRMVMDERLNDKMTPCLCVSCNGVGKFIQQS